MKAVAFFDCGGAHLNGKAQEIRQQLTDLLPHDHGVPDYETQDMLYVMKRVTRKRAKTKMPCYLYLIYGGGDLVEVYWSGDKKWFKGRVTGISRSERQFEVYYPVDQRQLWHNCSEYAIRRLLLPE